MALATANIRFHYRVNDSVCSRLKIKPMLANFSHWYYLEGGSQMAQYDVRGTWLAQQTNHFTTEFTIQLQQPDGQIAASARVLQGNNPGSGFGRVNGDQFTVTIGWNGGAKGVYIGEFDAQGVLHGATFDASAPQNVAGWTSDRAFARN
jgi:hypothetical protein